MAGLALWNQWLYEALAEATDREVMVLNLDAMEDYEAALSGVERHFLVYNNTTSNRTCRILFKHLPATEYLVIVNTRQKSHTAAELRRGFPLALRAGEHVRITLRHPDYAAQHRNLQQQHDAQNMLIRCYQLLQETAEKAGTSPLSHHAKQAFTEALNLCRKGRYPEALDAARLLFRQFPNGN
jgi:hypothetical protein